MTAYASGYETAMLGAGLCGFIGVVASVLLSHRIKNNGDIVE